MFVIKTCLFYKKKLQFPYILLNLTSVYTSHNIASKYTSLYLQVNPIFVHSPLFVIFFSFFPLHTLNFLLFFFNYFLFSCRFLVFSLLCPFYFFPILHLNYLCFVFLSINFINYPYSLSGISHQTKIFFCKD